MLKERTVNKITTPCLQACLFSTGIGGCIQITEHRGETEKERSARCDLNMEVISLWPPEVSNKNVSLDQEEQRGNSITLIFVEIVYKKIHKSYFLPLLRVSFKFMLACSMLKCPDGVWKQQSRLHGRARNTSLQFEMKRFIIN